jgi:hypothetical protein
MEASKKKAKSKTAPLKPKGAAPRPYPTAKGLPPARIELCIVDSFGQEYHIGCPAPLACKGTMTNPELPW